jgi:hypothetical protein
MFERHYAMNTNNRPVVPLLVLSVCLIFLGVSGIFGGYLMLSNPTGTVLGMPVTYLERTPFSNWFIPGLWLVFIWGLGSFVALAGLWLRAELSAFALLTFWSHEHWSLGLSILLGLALVVWLTVQVFTLPLTTAIQYILYGLALVLIFTPMLPSMREYYRTNENIMNRK